MQQEFVPLAHSSPIVPSNNRGEISAKTTNDRVINDIAPIIVQTGDISLRPIESTKGLIINDRGATNGVNTKNNFGQIKCQTQFWVEANKEIRASGKINAEGCKIEVPCPWNLELFDHLLSDYHDRDMIISHLKYGWPIEAKGVSILNKNTPKSERS